MSASPASSRGRAAASPADIVTSYILPPRYCEKRFVAKYLPTIGIDYGATRIFVDKREVGFLPRVHLFDHDLYHMVSFATLLPHQVSVHIFDTSGLDMFKEVRNEFYR